MTATDCAPDCAERTACTDTGPGHSVCGQKADGTPRHHGRPEPVEDVADYDPATDGGHFVADPTGGGTWHAGPEPVEDTDGPDAMRCDVYGHEPGPGDTCGACGAPLDLTAARAAAAVAVDLAAASHRTACERVGRLVAELDAAQADVRRFREEHAAAVDRHAALYG